MSRVTTVSLEAYPSGSTPPTVTASATPWAPGSWVEIIPSAPDALHIAAVELGEMIFTPQVEIEIGVGSLGNETTLHTVRNTVGSTAGESNQAFWMLPVPAGGFQAGDRVSVRARASVSSSAFTVALLAYSGLPETAHQTTLSLRTAPAAANAVGVTSNASLWAFSSWEQLTSGIANEIAIVGLTLSSGPFNTDMEFEVGFGAVSSEVPKTLVRVNHLNTVANGPIRFFPLPAPFPVPPNTPVSVRLRRSGTTPQAYGVSMVYIDQTALVTQTVSQTANETITVSDQTTVTWDPLESTCRHASLSIL